MSITLTRRAGVSPSNDYGPAGIQYAGEAGITRECVEAVLRLLQCRVGIAEVRILTVGQRHALLLTLEPETLLVVKSGFASRYTGEGSAGLSRVLTLLQQHGVEINEHDVSDELMQRLDQSALTKADLQQVNASRPIRPDRWYDYALQGTRHTDGSVWEGFGPVIPQTIIDPRIADLARAFWDAPGDRIMDGYRRLEDTFRARTGIDEHGAALFAAAFLKSPAKLVWPDCGENEQKGRAQLFAGAFMGYRNMRAHREVKAGIDDLLTEFLLLNHLFRLERQACEYVPTTP